jgi:GT2 family glycosyltransferase
VDWASAAFWVVPSTVYSKLGGFDENFFMYCEDVDFCLRMQLRGWRLVQVPVRARHLAHRGSHRQWRYLGWHIRSLLRLWAGQPLRQYLRRNASL